MIQTLRLRSHSSDLHSWDSKRCKIYPLSHGNHLGILLKCRFRFRMPRVGLRVCITNKRTGGARDAGQGTKLSKPLGQGF